MAVLYVIGGSPRSGKTAIVYRFIKQRPMVFIATDALRFGLRKALFDEAYVTADKLSFKGEVEFRRPGEVGTQHRQFSQQLHEDQLAWKATLGIIEHYDRRDEDMVIEGSIFSPDDINALNLQNLSVRAAFVGYTDPAHADTILERARLDNDDWINRWLEETAGDDKKIRRWISDEARKSQKSQQLAAKFGYCFSDLSKTSFEDHAARTLAYLLQAETKT